MKRGREQGRRPAWLSLTRRLTELCFIINVFIIIKGTQILIGTLLY